MANPFDFNVHMWECISDLSSALRQLIDERNTHEMKKKSETADVVKIPNYIKIMTAIKLFIVQ